jgi:hypothetical protein
MVMTPSSRHDFGLVYKIVGQKMEDQAMLGIFPARLQRQSPALQRIEQPVLRGLQFPPALQPAGIR